MDTNIQNPVPENTSEERVENLSAEDFNDILDELLPESHIADEQEVTTTQETPEEAPSAASEESLLPQNSPTLDIEETTSRFSGALWYTKIRLSSIILAGLGGIGSHVALNLGRLAPRGVTLYDNDVVDASNMSGQLYRMQDIGCPKVNAIVDTLYRYTDASSTSYWCIDEEFTEQSRGGGIMICGFDSMKARKTYFHAWLKYISTVPEEERKECLFLDGRLSLSVMQVFCITGDDKHNISRYEKEFLFDDSKAEPTMCSMKQTTYLASMIGAMMTNLFVNFIANTLDPEIPYSLPFFTEYDATYMLLRKEN